MLAEIGQAQKVDLTLIIDETINLLKNERSHKVLAQGINTFLQLGKLSTDNSALHQRLLELAKNYLKDVSQAVKSKCLEVIGVLTPVNCTDSESILLLVGSYFSNSDARVRSQAFSTMIALHERGLKLNPNIYMSVCSALKDDYEIVRSVVLKLVWLLGNAYPEKYDILLLISL